MSKKLMTVTVRGERSRWCFNFYGDPQYLNEWLLDGLEVYIVENTIPGGLPAWMPVRAYCFLQDLFNFRNPWRK